MVLEPLFFFPLDVTSIMLGETILSEHLDNSFSFILAIWHVLLVLDFASQFIGNILQHISFIIIEATGYLGY